MVRAGYKQTEAGMIPQDWESPELGEILSSTQLGGNYKNGEQETNWPLIKMGNLGRGSIVLERLEYIHQSVPPDDRDRLSAHDVLFNTRNTLDLVGKVAIWRDELPLAYFNSNIMRMEFDETRVHSHPLMNYVLNSAQALRELRGIAIGTTSVAAIYGRDMIKLRIPLPPTEAEQKAIAGALSDADALIESLEALIAKKRLIKQGAMQELLTGKTRLPGFSGKWSRKALKHVADLSRLGVDPGSTPNEYFTHFSVPAYDEGREPVVETGSMIGSSKFVVPPNAILVSKLNPRISRVWSPVSIPANSVCSTEFLVLVPRRNVDRGFVATLCRSQVIQQQMEEYATGTTGSHQRISPAQAMELKAAVPPSAAEQRAIAGVLSDMDAEIVALESRLAKVRQIKQGTMQELLTGRIRLV